MIELQRLLLGDTVRNDAFERALKAVIVPGKTIVSDIGSGTGYLSFLAEKLGAKECHLYEVSKDLLNLSEDIAKANGMKRCRFHAGHSTDVKKPVRADVVVSETLGNWPYEENIIETLNDALRFLKPGGIMIPQSLHSFVAPVITARLYDELNVWDQLKDDVDFSAAKEICMNNMYVKDVRPNELLETKKWDTVDFSRKNDSIRTATMQWPLKKPVTLYGFAVWWESDLTGNITLSTSPSESPTHWKQIYLPLVDPVTLQASDSVRLHLTSDSRYEVKINVDWQTEILNEKGKITKKMQQNIRKGYLQ